MPLSEVIEIIMRVKERDRRISPNSLICELLCGFKPAGPATDDINALPLEILKIRRDQSNEDFSPGKH